jgi:uncharacterized protein (DUF1697 family)
MTVVIAFLRGVNVVGNNKVSMDALREICVSLKLRNPQTYIQSGNIVLGSADPDHTKLAARIESAVEKRLGFRPRVMMRTAADLRDVAARNPFPAGRDLHPSKLVVYFLAEHPPAEIAAKVAAIKVGKEEIILDGRELYVYFPQGQGQSKLPPVLERTLKIPATARNWNTVTKLLAMAEAHPSRR